MMKYLYHIILFAVIIACNPEYDPATLEYISSIEKIRQETNNYMRNNPNSPFNYKGKVEFHELNYFNVNPDFKFSSKLYEYANKDTVIVYGTKGEPRKTSRFGYVKFEYENNTYSMNVYESKAKNGQAYYSLWFTDETTNDESYGVGRYLKFDKVDDENHLYKIDFNLAFNPYCAYSKEYSCAIPTKEDYIDLAIYAGEKKFHD